MKAFEPINPEGWLRAPGWSHAIAVKTGEVTFVKIAGQVGWDMTTQQLVADDLAAQYEQAIKNICSIVSAAGGEPQDIVELRIYTTNVKEYNERIKEMGQAYQNHIGKHFPTITLVGVTDLFKEEIKVEIEATAVIS
ncbi:RidA family protein [Paenibacillus xerothermodurans]|uniref:RidA family protein n=1 Tax=Paenibacillus xerothermodurans TaxID=1977292 RepID=A0A2W1P2N0_PAEXE|nr:RidA family protein [Paenibacillus xerothermodurans]PZE21388.1 RidA family protein [Paenibacillus xerothermodurans]